MINEQRVEQEEKDMICIFLLPVFFSPLRLDRDSFYFSGRYSPSLERLGQVALLR
jgi:hypothetical protein